MRGGADAAARRCPVPFLLLLPLMMLKPVLLNVLSRERRCCAAACAHRSPSLSGSLRAGPSTLRLPALRLVRSWVLWRLVFFGF